MTSPQQRKGDGAEREVAALLTDLLGVTCRRKLGAGRADDTGDMYGLPDTVVQVAAWGDLARAAREKLPATVRQMVNDHATFGALFVRRPGGRYVVLLTPEMFATYWREATDGAVAR
jgi:hypothetical protein